MAPGSDCTPLNPTNRAADKVKRFIADAPMERAAQAEIAPASVLIAAASASPIFRRYGGGWGNKALGKQAKRQR